MTNKQKERIALMRQGSCGYMTIAKAVGLTKDSVKAYCRTHGLAGVRGKPGACKTAEAGTCPHCRKPLPQTPGKHIRFCSALCRQQWWSANRDSRTRKGAAHVCAHCQKEYTSYDRESRYCSHPCYIAQRFGAREKRP